MNVFIIRALIGICLITALLSTSSFSKETSHPKQILVLASYNPGMKWEDSIDSAIRLHFAINNPSAVISIEYMDTKRIDPNQTRLDALKSLYIKKYTGRHFDLIIVSNTDAFNFLLKNRDEIFPGTPVVFCGVVNFDDKMLDGKRGFTGVVEAYDVADTLALMLHLHPHTQHIAVVTDQTVTGQANRKVLERTISNFKGKVSFEFLDNLSSDELRQRVASLANNSLILLMTFNRDSTGKVLTYEDSSELIRDASPVPIYSVYDFYLGYGVVGGKMISGTTQGEQATDLALRVLQGEPAEKIPVVKTGPNQYMFDMFELNRFGINLTSLPPDSTIINQPFGDRARLIGMNLSGQDISGANMSGSDLHGSNLNGTNLSGANLIRSDLQNSSMEMTNLSRSSLNGAIVNNARLFRANLSGADLEGDDIMGCDLSFADLSYANLVGSDLTGSNLTGADLTGADLQQARLGKTDFVGAKLDDANLTATNFVNSNLSSASLVGSYLRRTQLRNSILLKANLTRASLVGANLIDADLSHADLTKADISESRCYGAKFVGSRLINSYLAFANLTGTNLSMANLSGSYLVASELTGSDLSKANLSGANLETAYMQKTKVIDAKLLGTVCPERTWKIPIYRIPISKEPI